MIYQSFHNVSKIQAVRYSPENKHCITIEIFGLDGEVQQNIFFGDNEAAAVAFWKGLGGTCENTLGSPESIAKWGM